MLNFEWNPEKAESNIRKHGVTFEEGAMVLRDPLSSTTYDPDHSHEEERFLTIGSSDLGKILVVSHVDRGDKIRIISVRRATRREQRAYENG